MKKLVSFALVLFFCLTFCFNAFSLSGVFSGEKNLKVIKTEWFDIIYSQKSEVSAKKIAAVCDDYYLEIAKKLGTERKNRYPVSITSAVESMNAYFSMALFNHIVVYDTYLSEDLDMDEETIENVFYHELTHAVSLNIKSKLFEGLSHLADFLTPAGLSLTTFWFEGVTVSFEGRDTLGGRLNDPFATQLVSTAKLKDIRGEKKFPSWRDVTGARDIIPGGTDAYMFGSAFAQYLQKKYGMEKYGEFWKNAGTSTSFSFSAGVLKKTYGVKMDDAWKDFYDSIPTLETDLKTDEKNSKNLLSDKKSYIKTFDIYKDNENTKIAWFDSQSSAVFLYDSEKNKTKRLVTVSGIQKLNFSPDGKKLSVTRFVSRSNTKSEVGYIDIKKKNYTTVKKSDSVNAYFDFDENLKFSSIQEEKNKTEFTFSPLCIDENKTARIVKKGLEWRINIEESGTTYDINFENKVLHNLHLVKTSDNETILSFTWAELGKGFQMLSRAGFVKLDFENRTAEVYLQNKNAPLGIVDSALIDCNSDSEKKEFICTFDNYDSRILATFNLNNEDFDSYKSPIEVTKFCKTPENSVEEPSEFSQTRVETTTNPITSSTDNNFEETNYNPFRYYKNGAKFPIAIVQSTNADFSSGNSFAFLGATFVSCNPWTDGRFIFSAGWDPTCFDGGFMATYMVKNNAYSLSLNGNCLFDGSGFLQTSDSISFSSIFFRHHKFALSFGASSSFFYGEEAELIDFLRDEDEVYQDPVSVLHSKLLCYLQFSNITKYKAGIRQYLGFYIQPFLIQEYENYSIFDSNIERKYINAGATVGARFPGFFPLSLTANLFPSEGTFASASANVLLYSYEIQKGIPALSLFVNRIVVQASYSGAISYVSDEFFDISRTADIAKDISKSDYSDSLSLTAYADFRPNTGYFAGATQFSLGGSFIYRPNPQPNKKNFAFGLYFDVNL